MEFFCADLNKDIWLFLSCTVFETNKWVVFYSIAKLELPVIKIRVSEDNINALFISYEGNPGEFKMNKK